MPRVDDVEVEIDEQEMRKLFGDADWRRIAETAALGILGHAIPHSGVDYGELVGSMNHDLVEGEGGVIEAVLGSNADTGTPTAHAAANWGGPETHKEYGEKPDGDRRPRKKRPHEIKDVPTTPWTKALRELGIEFETEPGTPEF